MRRIEASRKNARPLRLRFSQSLASLRQRLSHAIVRSRWDSEVASDPERSFAPLPDPL
jgi:hypothetical protein